MTAYYNEINPYAAQWLRNLIAADVIAPGYVDERSIEDVRPDDLREFAQCHFFAGVGVWSYALRRAGWPDNKPVWTGSCPCQPFSAAGKGAGVADERHLWPPFYHLITQCSPGVVFGEQVASKAGLAWLDLVQADLEGAGYASGALDICSAGVGAPHIRQRSWVVAERLALAPGGGREVLGRGRVHSPGEEGPHVNDLVEAGGMADSERDEREKRHKDDRGRDERGEAERLGEQPRRNGSSGGLADSESLSGGAGLCDPRPAGLGRDQSGDCCGVDSNGQPGPTNGLWRDVDWLYCRDGKWRPVRPGSFPLVNGAPARVGRLSAYGNAINAETATEFIRAYTGG